MYHVVISSLLPCSAPSPFCSSSSACPAATVPLPSLCLDGELPLCRVELGHIHFFRRCFDEPTSSSSAVPPSSAANGAATLLLALPTSLTLARLLSALCAADAPLLLSSLRSCVRVCDPHSGQHSVVLEWADAATASLFCQSVDGRPLPVIPPQSAAAFGVEQSSVDCLAFSLSDSPSVFAAGSCVLTRVGFAELPRCPRCLLRLDTSCSGIVAAFSIDGGRRDRDRRDAHDGPMQAEQQLSNQTGSVALSGTSSARAGSLDGSLSGCWVDVRCAVCDKLAQAAASVSSPSSIQCSECSVVGSEREAIWLCLVCGHVGCGRNLSGHAAVHFELTGHRYCIELLQHYVWDYHADGFVHRVHGRDNVAAAAGSGSTSQRQQLDSEQGGINSRFARGEYDSDTELELDEADEDEWLHTDEGREGQSHSPTNDGEEDDGLLHGKLASITSHYSHLLQSELSKQADFFEQLVLDKRATLDSSNSQHSTHIASMQHSIAGLHLDVDSVSQAVRQCRVQLAERRRRNGAQHDENNFIKQINSSLITDQQQQQQQHNNNNNKQQQQVVGGSAVTSSPRTQTSLAAKQRRISGLQADIARLMQQLDTAHSSSSNRAAR